MRLYKRKLQDKRDQTKYTQLKIKMFAIIMVFFFLQVNTLTKNSFNEENRIFVICNSCGLVIIDNSSKHHLVVI